MNQERVKVGVIGCGNISGAYFRTNQSFDFFDIVACADLDLDRAKARAEEFGIARACTPEEMLRDDEVSFVISLTIPQAHAPVMLDALRAGKSAYTEKPFTVERAEAQQVLAEAKSRGLRVGSAPDTFLGGGHQTARRLIDEGRIGVPVAATASMLCPGHEHWHPAPEFYYKAGGGPLFDMGPYYLTALVNLLGPIARATGSARATRSQRTITSQPLSGSVIDVEVPTHVAGVLDFEGGAIATLITSFDVHAHGLPHIEIYGTEGSLRVPDPNGFGGPVLVRRHDSSEWEEAPIPFGYNGNARGVGMADMALAMRSGRAHRASGELAYHVLDAMHAILESSESGRHVRLSSTCSRPEPLPMGLRDGELDA